MSLNLFGWVEIKRYRWIGLLELQHILTQAGGYMAMERLLGTPLTWDRLEDADLRGLPSDRSEEARETWGDLDDLETTTWVGWNEIEAVDWSTSDADSDDWQRLIEIVKVLLRDESITDVRLLIEFN